VLQLLLIIMTLREKIKIFLKSEVFIYIVLCVLSLSFSFFRIDHQSLWNDESISVEWAAKKPLLWIWENVPKSDLHPPLYYSVLHFWQLIFSDSVFSIRSLSALFFVGSVLLVYLLAKNLFSSKKIALLTAVIFVTNPFAVLYAQEARSYSMLIFFVLLNGLLFYHLLYLHDRRMRNYYLYFFSALILIYTNILSLFVLVAHFLILLFKKDWKNFRNFIYLYILLFLTYIPVLGTIAKANSYDFSYFSNERLGIIMKVIVTFAGFIGARINILNGKWHIYPLLVTSLAVYGLFFSVLIFKIKQVNRFLLWFFTVSFTLLLIAVHIKFPVHDPKYIFVAFPFFILLIGNILAILKNRWAKLAVFLVIILFNLIFLYNYYFVKQYERENWKSVVAQVETDYLASSKTALVVSPVSEAHATWQYYAHDLIPTVGALKYGDNSTASIYKALSEAVGNPPKDVVYVSRFIWELYDPQDNIRAYLESHEYVKTGEFKDTKVEFWKYERVRNKK
jgi:4-amino-4-deoxy-L-arabinose transferase-like glycosyltransferase